MINSSHHFQPPVRSGKLGPWAWTWTWEEGGHRAETLRHSQHNRTAAGGCSSAPNDTCWVRTEAPAQSKWLDPLPPPLAFCGFLPQCSICKATATLRNLFNNVWVSGRSKGGDRQAQGSGERLTHRLRHSSGSWTEKPSKMPVSGKYCRKNILVISKMKHMMPPHKNNVSCPCHC